ncbi:MAG: hypothetical protein Q8Q15_00510 [bacterium]|nr:hypothetical protein [bacterium]
MAELEKTRYETMTVREKIGIVVNKLILAKMMVPLSEKHREAMEKLVEILASEPEALEELIKQQDKMKI